MISPRTRNALFPILTPCLLAVLVSAAGAADRRIPAFPGAEGFGAFATGGRGGKICLVTTLEDYGPNEKPIEGSLRAASVFSVSISFFSLLACWSVTIQVRSFRELGRVYPSPRNREF